MSIAVMATVLDSDRFEERWEDLHLHVARQQVLDDGGADPARRGYARPKFVLRLARRSIGPQPRSIVGTCESAERNWLESTLHRITLRRRRAQAAVARLASELDHGQAGDCRRMLTDFDPHGFW